MIYIDIYTCTADSLRAGQENFIRIYGGDGVAKELKLFLLYRQAKRCTFV
jgi:hypothetical protein